MSGFSPSQSRSSRIAWSNSAVDRSRSVSSMRRMNLPPFFRANKKLCSAVRILPTCSRPVGDGAKRVTTLTVLRSSGHLHVRTGVEEVGDRVAPVAPEVTAADLHAGRRLAAFILGFQQLALDVGD